MEWLTRLRIKSIILSGFIGKVSRWKIEFFQKNFQKEGKKKVDRKTLAHFERSIDVVWRKFISDLNDSPWV